MNITLRRERGDRPLRPGLRLTPEMTGTILSHGQVLRRSAGWQQLNKCGILVFWPHFRGLHGIKKVEENFTYWEVLLSREVVFDIYIWK